MGSIHCSINGQDVSCESGTTVLEAARAAGIDIPSLCYFKELNQIGACRICVVEIEGMPRLMAACTTQVKSGMVIHTESEAVIASRKRSLDLICKRHRMDCEYCPNYSFCELHAVIRRLGIDDRPYSQIYHERRVDKSSSCIVRDNSKCVRCRRCVATCKKQGVEAISALYRAEATAVGALLPMAETNCIDCGQCVRNCPTGALFVKDDTDLLWRAQNNHKKIVIGIMPESANNIGRFWGAKADRNEMARLAAVCRKAGAYEVLDLTGLRDLAVSELVPEITRCKEAGKKTAVSICPAEKYRECQQEEILWGRNPETIFREKAVELIHEKGISEEELFLVYVSPCTAAKRSHASDAVLTTAELFQWIQRACVSRFTTLDVWNKAAEETALPLLKDDKPSVDESETTVVYACPGGCANGGGQFRAKAYQK